jgi:hypothetical protein
MICDMEILCDRWYLTIWQLLLLLSGESGAKGAQQQQQQQRERLRTEARAIKLETDRLEMILVYEGPDLDKAFLCSA